MNAKKILSSRWFGPVVLLSLSALFCADVLFVGRMFLFRDTILDFDSWRQVVNACLADGEFPFWDKIGGGKPYLGGPYNAMFYPLNVIYLFLPLTVANNWFCCLQIFLLGLSVYMLAREFGAEKNAALMAGAGVMLSTWMMGYMEFPSCAAAAPWVFFITTLLARFWRNASAMDCGVWARVWRLRRMLAGLALLIAVFFLANYYEFFVYGAIGCALFAVVALIHSRDVKTFWSLALAVALAGALAMALVAPQLLAIWQHLPFTERGDTYDTRFWMGSMTPAHWLKWALPTIGGLPGYPDTHWARGSYEFWVGTFYTGALALLAMPFAFLYKNEDGTANKMTRMAVWWGAAAVAAGLLFSLGENTPVYPWFWKHVPLMDRFRQASKFLILVMMGGAALTTLGLQYILKPASASPWRRRLLVAQGIIIGLLGVLVACVWCKPSLMPAIFNHTDTAVSDARLGAALRGVVWSYVLLLLAYGWILWAANTVRRRALHIAGLALVFVNMLVVSRMTLTTTPSAALAMQPQVPQKFAHNDYRSLSMYTDAQQYFYNDPRVDIYRWGLEAGAGTAWHPHPGFLLWHQNGGKMQTFRTLTAGMHGGNAQARDNFMDVAGIRWVFGGAPWPQIMWGGAARELRFSERPSAIPRFTLYTNWQPVPDIPAALHWLASADNAELHRRPAVEDTALVRGRECRMSLPSATGATPSAVDAVTLLEDRNNSLSLRVRGSGLLVVSDTWHPGWRATIDGVEAPVHRANHMFRGVFIPAGEHTVRFDYWPVNFGWHLAASALGLCIIGGLFIRRR